MNTEMLAINRRDKYTQIYEMLYSDLLVGKYSMGQKIPNAVDLAKKYGVSRPTITRAIERLEKDGIVVRRQGAGTFVTQNIPAVNSKLGVLSSGLKVEPKAFKGFASLFGQVVSSIANSSHGTDYVMLMNELPFSSDEDEALGRALEISRQLINMGVRGVFFVPFNVSPENKTVNGEIVNIFRNAGVHVVLIDRDICEYPHRSSCDLVEIDNRRAGFKITEHLISLGCHKIDFLTGLNPASTTKERIKGYKDALKRHGIEPESSRVHRFGLSQPDSKQELKLVKDILANTDADAFVCSTDRLAPSLMRNLEKVGIRIPEQIRVVGFDGEPFTEYLPVPLTTVCQPAEAIGSEAFRLMKSRIDNPQMPVQTVTLETELIVRQSCGAKLEARK
ncbi:MAG: substrate-binding domain-containing protein [Planctomycetota bacterium]